MHPLKMETEKNRMVKKKSAQAIGDEVSKQFNTTVSARSVQCYVQENMAGESTKKRGPDGCIAAKDFKILTIVYESFFRIEQVNADNTKSHLTECIHNTINSGSTTDHLLQQLQRDFTIYISAKVSNLMEQQHIHWTNYSNQNAGWVIRKIFLMTMDLGHNIKTE